MGSGPADLGSNPGETILTTSISKGSHPNTGVGKGFDWGFIKNQQLTRYEMKDYVI